jgi:CheY-like chemotaxis protein/predicted Ser/Thr protein kinase
MSGQAERDVRVVVVEDDPDQLEALAGALRDASYNVEAFADPRAAITAVEERPPALVITDLTMPGLSGLDVIRAIRDRWSDADVPVMVLSGLGEEETMVECFSAGASDYLTKPIKLAELRAKTSVLIKRSGMTLVQRRDEPVPGPRVGDELPPDSIFGSYRIVRRLGAGGMGVIYEARTTDGAPVALKVLTPELSRDSALLKRFFREAQHLKEVRHPNIVSFHDVGCVGQMYFIVMEYVAGDPLDLRYEAVLPIEEALAAQIGSQIAEALSALHRVGIVHRDLKPANVMVGEDGQVKLIDFGLTKHSRDEKLTDTNVLIGTPHFISPEQLTGSAPVDIRADLYALGVILFFLLSGRHPFEGATPFEILRAHVGSPAPSLREMNPEISPWMDALVARLLSKRPEDRFETPDEVLRLLASAAILPGEAAAVAGSSMMTA